MYQSLSCEDHNSGDEDELPMLTGKMRLDRRGPSVVATPSSDSDATALLSWISDLTRDGSKSFEISTESEMIPVISSFTSRLSAACNVRKSGALSGYNVSSRTPNLMQLEMVVHTRSTCPDVGALVLRKIRH